MAGSIVNCNAINIIGYKLSLLTVLMILQGHVYAQNLIDLNHRGQLTIITQGLIVNNYDDSTNLNNTTKVRAFHVNPVITYNVWRGLEVGAHVRLKYAYNNVQSDQWNYFEKDYGLLVRKIFQKPLLNIINTHEKLKFKKRVYIYPYIESRVHWGDHYILPNGLVKEYSSISINELVTRVGTFINWDSRFSIVFGLEFSIHDRFSVGYSSAFIGVNFQYGKYKRREVGTNE